MMKHPLPLCLLLCSAGLFCTESSVVAQDKNPTPSKTKPASVSTATFPIFENGVPLAKLYVPASVNRTTLLAIEELQSALQAMTGSRMEPAYVGDQEFFAYGRPRFTQFVLEIRPESEWKGKQSPQGFQIVGDTKRPNRNTFLIRGNSPVGLLYGVYDFLDQQGVRFYAPGEDGTILPRRADIRVPVGVREIDPVFTRREMNFGGTHETNFQKGYDIRKQVREYTTWHMRNHLLMSRNVNSGEYPFTRTYSGGAHGIGGAREGVDFAKNPERFRMVDGKRVKNGQICWTNQENIDTTTANMLRFYEKVDKEFQGNELYEEMLIPDISLFDWAGAMCECPDCLKEAGTDQYKLDRLVWSFMNKVARNVAAKRPDGKLSLFAPYLELTVAPPDVKIEPNIIAMACRSEAWMNKPENQATYPFTKFYDESVRSNLKAGAGLAVYEYILWQETPQPLDILDAIAKYRDLGAKYYTAEVMQRNDLWYPVFWTMARSLFYDDKTPHEYLRQYCLEYFGDSFGKLALNFYNDMTDSARQMERRIYGGFESTATIMSDELIKKYRNPLAHAVGAIPDGPERRRALRFQLAFETAAKTAEIYRAHCNALNFRDDASIAKVRNLYKDFQGFYPQVAEHCTPWAWEELIAPLSKIDYKNLKPSRVAKYDSDEAYGKALFIGAVPQKIENLFKLPELWKFRIDPAPDKSGAPIQEDFDDSKGWPLISTWDWFESQGYHECGAQFWYRLRFDAPTFPEGKRVFLRIGALDDSGEVFLNGKKVGESSSSMNWDKSFEMDVTDVLKQGKPNTITVRGYDAFGAGGIWSPSALYTQ